MINSVRIRNFKCFLDKTIKFNNLTILTGINGVGKSTVIQSILLLRQAMVSGSIEKNIVNLNGNLVSLGLGKDILYEGADDGDGIMFDVLSNKSISEKIHLSYDYESDQLECNYNSTSDLIDSVFSQRNFYYLNSNRVSPKACYNYPLKAVQKYNLVGNSGEFSIYLLSQFDRQKIGNELMMHGKEEINSMLRQTECWLSEIREDIRIHLKQYPDLDKIGVKYSFYRNGMFSNEYRATNVGFGLTYCLPIIISCLHSKPGSIIIIENPEAHLHPKGQVALGKFISKVAASGTQIIIETHSEHILNGIRISVKNNDVNNEDISLHYFNWDIEEECADLITPIIDDNGRINEWPEGFFDEWEKGLMELL